MPALSKFFFLEAIYFLRFHFRRLIETSPALVILTFSIVHDGLTTNLLTRALLNGILLLFSPNFRLVWEVWVAFFHVYINKSL